MMRNITTKQWNRNQFIQKYIEILSNIEEATMKGITYPNEQSYRIYIKGYIYKEIDKKIILLFY